LRDSQKNSISFNNIPGYIFRLSEDGLVLDLNKLMEEVLGYEHREVVGKLRFEDLLTSGSKIFYKTHIVTILMMGGRVDEMYFLLKSKSGSEIPFLVNMKMNLNDGVKEIYGAGLQYSKRNKFEKELIEAKQVAERALTENELLNQMKSELEESQEKLEIQIRELKRVNEEHVSFSKILAHDLQEPLRKLQVFSSRLQEKNTHEIDFNSLLYLDRIYNISQYTHQLLIRLQKYHSLKISANDYTTESLTSVFYSAISKLDLQNLTPDFDKLQVKEIYGDIPKLTRCFEELIQNSYQFKSTERPLSIRISSTMVKDNYYQDLDDTYYFIDFVKIRYSDNAMGFPDFSLATLFKPLQKYHKQSGIGLGLAYCKKTIVLHKGKITMKPLPEGGSEFIILLPARGLY